MMRRFSFRRALGIATLLAGAVISTGAPVQAQAPGSAIVRVEAKGSVSDVVDHLKKMVGQNGMMVMGNLNQGKVLSMAGLDVESETLFVGNPQVGKKLFSADPGVGLVVPIRVNVYQNAQGHTVVTYLPPSVLLKAYGSSGIDEVAQMLDAKLHKMVQMLAS